MSDEKLGRDPKWFNFIPHDDITAKEVADVLVALAWAVDETVYYRLPQETRRNFIEKPESAEP